MTLATVAAVLSVISIVSMAVAVPVCFISFFEVFSRSKSSGADTAAHWLTAHGYRYLVVRRGGTRTFDGKRAVAIETAGGETLHLQKTLSDDGREVFLHCHSAGREAKEKAMLTRFGEAFEAGLQKIVDGLQKPRGEKRYAKLQERIGRLKEKSHGVSPRQSLTQTS